MKKYGIRMTLPKGDPMAQPHLLGEGWETYRWYDTEQKRDKELTDMLSKHPYYRTGDSASLIYSKTERDA
ncbi:MAG: hypothetical protein KDK04_25485 [Candidatus Competibacteraceae bacterium]|nr:hypothetical protein [Candidatus Competibacteraceae bacterium]MCB1807998.1 hypothetical protein [Candidatus Competibacteraceae bacterium]MCB1815043.1 hypothetical protein [Candidatus Competibacteraceae bacterium]